MRHNQLTLSIIMAGLALGSSAQAADVRINGFMSVVGGMTVSEGTARNRFTGAENRATFTADNPTAGIYDDDISFKPDTIYGLQIRADLGQGLSATGMITGAGGADFDANVSWAYINYQLNDSWGIQAGRQRLPLYFYSDFLDVGYTYHWIRVPQVLPATFTDTYEGVKGIWTHSSDNWDWQGEIYGGAGSAEPQGTLVKTNNTLGSTLKVSNDWLQLRATYMQNELVVPSQAGALNSNGVAQATADNPMGFAFYGVAAHMTFDNVFVIAEYAGSALDEPLGIDFNVNGSDSSVGWYISSGIRLGNFTPHITYGVSTATISGTMPALNGNDIDNITEMWSAGVRWDFHPSAAFKAEYTSNSDDSDDLIKNGYGFQGLGDSNETDVISFGIDLIF